MTYRITSPVSPLSGQTLQLTPQVTLPAGTTPPTLTALQTSGPSCTTTVLTGTATTTGGSQTTTYPVQVATGDPGMVIVNLSFGSGDGVDVTIAVQPFPPPTNVTIPLPSFEIV